MAFSLPNYIVPTDGAAAPYWVINRVSFNPIEQTINVMTNGYTSAADFSAGLSPVTSEPVEITGSTYATFLGAVTSADIPAGTTQGDVLLELMNALETSMLTLPFFSGATIVS